ncbi:MAG: LysM peptidoglycan-binding domain-containing protein [Clostridia bacterium]|nr:LysM peptidoglycan-binding domain-containing protein [Clostridia bacterium]
MQRFYIVRRGDTAYSIARRWGIPVDLIVASNNLLPPYVIFPGQQLSIPPGVNTTVVEQGESVFSISQKYGVPPQVIIEANALTPPFTIQPGQVLNVPPGVPYYTVQSGDTLYGIARRFNVTVNGQPRPEYIEKANQISQNIVPGMRIRIPYPPPGGTGKIAYVTSLGQGYGLWIYDPGTGNSSLIASNEVEITSIPYWSPDRTKIAFVGKDGILYVIHVATKALSGIDQLNEPFYLDWSPDSRKLAYSKPQSIIIYDIAAFQASTLNIPGTSYVQWFPNGTELLYEARDTANVSQLYRINTNGSRRRQITNNTFGSLNWVSLSPDGAYVLYTSPGVSVSLIYTLELATGRTYQVPGGPEAKNYYPLWSPDSQKIAYSSTTYTGGRYYSLIRAAGARGENDRTWAISSCYSTPVGWSLDSRKAAYLSGCLTGTANELWIVDLTKPVPMLALRGMDIYSFSWAAP